MPLRRTERSNGRQRPKWKDGSHDSVENTLANISRCICLAVEPTPQTEQLVTVPPMLGRKHEPKVSTRDRRAKTGADARIEEFAAIGELRLALRPYGKRHFTGSETPRSVSTCPARRSKPPKQPCVRSVAVPVGSLPRRRKFGSCSRDCGESRASPRCAAARTSNLSGQWSVAPWSRSTDTTTSCASSKRSATSVTRHGSSIPNSRA